MAYSGKLLYLKPVNSLFWHTRKKIMLTQTKLYTLLLKYLTIIYLTPTNTSGFELAQLGEAFSRSPIPSPPSKGCSFLVFPFYLY